MTTGSSRDDGEDTKRHVVIVSRALSLDTPNILKSVHAIKQQGEFAEGHVKTLFYASRDLRHWHRIGNSRTEWLRGMHGTGYRWFRVVALAELDKGENIFGLTMEYSPRSDGRLR